MLSVSELDQFDRKSENTDSFKPANNQKNDSRLTASYSYSSINNMHISKNKLWELIVISQSQHWVNMNLIDDKSTKRDE